MGGARNEEQTDYRDGDPGDRLSMHSRARQRCHWRWRLLPAGFELLPSDSLLRIPVLRAADLYTKRHYAKRDTKHYTEHRFIHSGSARQLAGSDCIVSGSFI